MRTTLQAVQEMARRLGKHPPAGLDTGGNSLQAQLERVLDDASNSVQSEGWFWNTKHNITVTPTGSKIQVNQLENVADIGVSPIYATIFHVDTDGTDSNVNVVRNGDYLYNLTDNTDTFTSSIKLTYTYKREFENVPEAFQSWIIALASFNYNRHYIGDKSSDGALQVEMQDARRQATREEIRSADVNVLNTQEMRQIRGRRRTPDRSVYE
tara:strand:- start:5994 stop:6626 length:633 start_codon:yes stop_codon:yes gene_type:complete